MGRYAKLWGSLGDKEKPLVEPDYWELDITTTSANTSYAFGIQAGTSINLNVDYLNGATQNIQTVNYNSTGLKSYTFEDIGNHKVRLYGSGTGLNLRFGNAGFTGATGTLIQKVGIMGNLTGTISLALGFRDCPNINNVDFELFKFTGSRVTAVQNLFMACTSLVHAPKYDYLKGQTNYEHRDAFRGCTALKTAPSLKEVWDISGNMRDMFFGCTSLELVPEFPESSTRGVRVDGCFNNVGSGMKGTVEELWNTTKFPNIALFTNCFRTCTGLDNYDDIPDNWKGL
jgi:hypothetical protein